MLNFFNLIYFYLNFLNFLKFSKFFLLNIIMHYSFSSVSNFFSFSYPDCCINIFSSASDSSWSSLCHCFPFLLHPLVIFLSLLLPTQEPESFRVPTRQHLLRLVGLSSPPGRLFWFACWTLTSASEVFIGALTARLILNLCC